MKTVEMIGPCGINCEICELYVCRENKELFDFLVSRGIPDHKLPCPGCRELKGKCPVIGDTCATYSCAEKQDVEFCSECTDFPCGCLQPAADRADILPHNLKIYNLMMIDKKGKECFREQSKMIKARYYEGKMEIGRGPQLSGEKK